MASSPNKAIRWRLNSLAATLQQPRLIIGLVTRPSRLARGICNQVPLLFCAKSADNRNATIMTKRNRADEKQPDYRYTLANERTFLAWIRTALAILATGIAIAHFAPSFSVPGGGQIIAILLTISSIACVGGAAWRWNVSQRAMSQEAPLPSTLMPWLLALAITSIGLVVFVLTLMLL